MLSIRFLVLLLVLSGNGLGRSASRSLKGALAACLAVAIAGNLQNLPTRLAYNLLRVIIWHILFNISLLLKFFC
ncbi:hypothetical protein POJ06DRAFT_252628 [Lipomyces tetrasporus]|uniref:Secreted protein n=1 Tax=Lipomyces tetrasporus TaxID=54092 RepID=A0AAD7QS88_9ASCO|nr:uncharacterized protein POJ06DRAFT_252628 [Lipomyces tetrasporus]KAJ8100410.1 hypothetical protein POJ06DRAFT_252628 [Lipomyces tetrasporus]